MDSASYIRYVPVTFIEGFLHYPVERCVFVRRLWKIGITPHDRAFVPAPDPGGIDLGKIDGAVRLQAEPRKRIIHDGGPVFDAGGEVMGESQGVPYLMRGKLPDPGQRHFLHFPGHGFPVDIGLQQSFGDEEVLPVPVRAKGDDAFYDFPGPWIYIGKPIGKCPLGRSRPVHPVDHVVADIHRIGAFRQFPDLKGVFETGRLKGLVPPGGAFDQGLLNNRGRPPVYIVNDRFHGLAEGGGRIFLVQPAI